MRCSVARNLGAQGEIAELGCSGAFAEAKGIAVRFRCRGVEGGLFGAEKDQALRLPAAHERLGGFEMQRIADLKYRTKLSLIIAGAILGISLLTAISFWNLSRVKIGGELSQQQIQAWRLESDLCPPSLSVHPMLEAMLLAEDKRDAATTQKSLANLKAVEQEFEKSYSTYNSTLRAPKLKEALNGGVHTIMETYIGILNNEYIPLVEAGKYEEARALRHRKLVPLREEHDAAVSEMRERVHARAKEIEAQSAEAVWNAELLMAVVALGLMGATCWLCLSIFRHIEAQVGKLQGAAQALADGDLTHSIESDSEDELGEVARAMNTAFKKVGEAIGEISRHSETIASASEEISSSAMQISTSSETQKQQVRQVATAMQEMSSTVTQVSDNSNQAAENAQRPGQVAVARRQGRGGDDRGDSEAGRIDAGDGAEDRGAGEIERLDRQDHRHHRRHRRPDQPAGAECGDRGGAGRRAGARLCGGGRRGAQACRAHHDGNQGDRRHDRDDPARDQGGGGCDARRNREGGCRSGFGKQGGRGAEHDHQPRRERSTR